MKKLLSIFALTLAVMFAAQSDAKAQLPAYDAAIGLRATTGIGLTYKKAMNENAIEAILFTRLYSGYMFLNVTGLYEINKDIPSVDGLNWYFGGGADVGVFVGDISGLGLGIDGIVGLEYTFADIPINLSVDWKPRINLINGFGANFAGGAFSARYILGR